MASLSRSLNINIFLTTLLTLLAFLSRPTCAQTTTSTTSASTTSTSAAIYPSNSAFAYYGCYNETTQRNGTDGQRALYGGSMSALDIMTVPRCLTFCKNSGYNYAGLEYTRECYCAQHISSLSAVLPDSECDLPCMGDSSQICGGSLKVTVYQARTTKQGMGVGGKTEAKMGSVLALGIALAVLLCLA